MAQVFTVTADTSVVSISTLQTPNTVVLLSSISYPGHIVGIRDATGSASIAMNPIIVSTTLGQQFYDGTSSFLINQPYGQASVSSRNPTTWQLLNNVGFFTTLSNAFLEQLTSEYVSQTVVSSITERISTMEAGRLSVTNSILLLGNAEITGNVVVGGGVDFFSTLFLNQNLNLSSVWTVGGEVSIQSTLRVADDLIVGSYVCTSQDLIVGGNLYIQSSLTAIAALVPKALSVQTLTAENVNIGGGIFAGGSLSTMNNFAVGNSLMNLGNTVITRDIHVDGQTIVGSNAYFGKNLAVFSTFINTDFTTVQGIDILGSVLGKTNMSSLSDVFVEKETQILESTFVRGLVDIHQTGFFGSVDLGGRAFLLNLSTASVQIKEDASLTESLVTQNIHVNGNGVVLEDLDIGGFLSTGGTISTHGNLFVGGDLVLQSSISIPGTTFISGSILNVSTLNVKDDLSTTFMNVTGNLVVVGDIAVLGNISTSILGSKGSLVLSTLTLSNDLFVQAVGSIPLFQTPSLPDYTHVGSANIFNPYTLQVDEVTAVSSLSTSLFITSNVIVKNILNENGLQNAVVSISPTPSLLSAFIFNVPSYFMSTVSISSVSSFLDASTIAASSFYGSFQGDGALITDPQGFSSGIYALNLTTDRLDSHVSVKNPNIGEIGESVTTSTLFVHNDMRTLQGTFPSTANVWIAVGINNASTANVLLSEDGGATWDPNGQTSFNLFGSAITGTVFQGNNIYVATGAATDPKYTIQYSEDGISWQPITSGGFTSPVDVGTYFGATVVFDGAVRNTPRWVAGGGDGLGGGNTIQYSDGIGPSQLNPLNPTTWLQATNAFESNCFVIRVNPNLDQYPFLALGDFNFDPSQGGITNIKISQNGRHWEDLNFSLGLDAVAFGKINFGAGDIEVWLGTAGAFYFIPGISLNTNNSWNFLNTTGMFSQTVSDLHYNSNSPVNKWVLVGGNLIFYSQNGINWSVGLTDGGVYPLDSITFQTVYYSEAQQVWVAGAQAPQAEYTLWRSSDAQTWFSTTVGGFSTSTANDAAGYALVPYTVGSPFGGVTRNMLALGTGSFTGITPLAPQILGLNVRFGAFFPVLTTVTYLTSLNATNVFLNTIRGGAFSEVEDYPLVVVGNGSVPTKTIGRFSTIDTNFFGLPISITQVLPAQTGGFSPSGYGVTYYQSTPYSIWLATGDSPTSTNVIQYSPDGANWFGTNNSGGLRGGGRGIARGTEKTFLQGNDLSTTLVCVGKDPVSRNRIVYSENGFDWISSSTDTFFNTASPLDAYGNGVVGGLAFSNDGCNSFQYPIFVAVGKSSLPEYTILLSSNASNWGPITSGGFNIQGNAVATNSQFNGPPTTVFLAVGEDTRPVYRVQLSTDGGSNWIPVGPSTGIDAVYGCSYGVAVQDNYPARWFITGRATNAFSNELNTIWMNPLPGTLPWTPVQTGSGGFLSLNTVGEALGVFSQTLNTVESWPVIQMDRLAIYNRKSAIDYPYPTIRLQSTQVVFKESLHVNLSTQIYIASNAPFSNNTVTVNGDVYASSIIYAPSENVSFPTTLNVSSIIVSSVYNKDYTLTNTVTTPYITFTNRIDSSALINTPNMIKFQAITAYDQSFLSNSNNPSVNINDTLHTGLYSTSNVPFCCINTPSTTSKFFSVAGTSAVSSLITSNVLAQTVQASTLTDIFVKSQTLTMFKGDNSNLVTSGNTIFTTPSTMIFNSILTLNLSTQRVGVYTENPQFDLDVQTQAFLTYLTANTVQTDLFFVTLASV